MGAARLGARLYSRCRARAVPFTSAVGTAKPRHACASCSSNTTFGAAFAACASCSSNTTFIAAFAAGGFGDLCHEG